MTINYLAFTENNIQFRIVSSKMIERYKASQSFVLSEMLHGEYKFSKTSKEIALLVMDVTFGWLISFENYLIRDGVDFFDENAKTFIINSAIESEKYYMDIIKSRTDIFDNEIVSVWDTVHQSKFNMIIELLNKNIGKSDIESFSTIVSVLIEMIDTLKFELYEIDYLVHGGNKPFLCLTDLTIMSLHDFGQNQLISRGELYSSHFNIEKKFLLKNYSQEHNPIIYLREFEDAGFNIPNKFSLITKM